MLDPVPDLGVFCVVEAVKSSDKVACDSADALKFLVSVILTPTAAWALITNNACKPAYRVTVNRGGLTEP